MKRRWYVNKNHGGCDNDAGWLVVQQLNGNECPWGTYPAYPVFLYSKLNTVDLHNSKYLLVCLGYSPKIIYCEIQVHRI